MKDTPNSLLEDIQQSWSHLERPERKRMGLLLGASLVTIAVDLLSLAAILPVVLMVLQPDFWDTAPLPDSLRNELLSWPLRTRQVAVLGSTLVLFVLKNTFGYYVQRARISFFKKLVVGLSRQTYRNILEGTSLQAFLERHGGEGIQQLVFIPTNFVNHVIKGLFSLITEGVLLLVLISVMVIYDPPVFLTAIAALSPGIVLLVYLRRRSTQRIGGAMKSIFNDYLQYAVETVRGYLDITLSPRKETFVKEHTRRSKHFHYTQQRIFFLKLTTPRLVESAAVMGIVSILGYLVFTEASALKATVTLGIFLAGTYKLIPSFTALISAYTLLNTHRFTIPEIKDLLPEDTAVEPIAFQNSVTLSSVSFAYDKGSFALQDLTLDLNKGEKVALMGPSGGGKTTLIHLLLGLFTPQTGALQVDGQALSPAQVKGWRQQVSYVPQTPLLLETTLASNIAFGVPEDEIDWDWLQRVVEEAELSAYIQQLPEGLHTSVGAEGRKISGGQRQRVALARALYQNRPVLILDEVTANLDETTEAAVVDTLVKLSQGDRTILFITHRPQILEHCDRFLELKEGRLSSKKLTG